MSGVVSFELDASGKAAERELAKLEKKYSALEKQNAKLTAEHEKQVPTLSRQAEMAKIRLGLAKQRLDRERAITAESMKQAQAEQGAKVGELNRQNKERERMLAAQAREAERLRKALEKANEAGGKTSRAGAGAGVAVAGFAAAAKSAMLFAGALVGVNGLQSAIRKVLDLAREAYRNVRQLESQAFDENQSFASAVGAFRLTNPGMTESEKQYLIAQARELAPVLGGANAGARVLKAIQDTYAGAPGIDPESLVESVREAARLGMLAPESDIGSFAQATARAARATGLRPTTAANLGQMWGHVSGVSAQEVFPEAAMMASLRETSGNTIEELMAGHSIFTAAGFGPEEATTIMTNLTSRIMARGADVRIKGKRLQFQSDDAMGRFAELGGMLAPHMEGKSQEEAAKTFSAITRGLGREAASSVLGLVLLARKQEDYRERLAKLQAASATDESLLLRETRVMARDPANRSVFATRASEARTGLAEQSDIQGATSEASLRQLANFKREIGEFNPLEDMEGQLQQIRDAMRRMGGVSPEEYRRLESLRVYKKHVDMPEVRDAFTMREAALGALRGGFVTADGGLSRAEQMTFRQAGMTEDAVRQLANLGKTDPAELAKILPGVIQQAISRLEAMPDQDRQGQAWRDTAEAMNRFREEIGMSADLLQDKREAGAAAGAGISPGEYATKARLRMTHPLFNPKDDDMDPWLARFIDFRQRPARLARQSPEKAAEQIGLGMVDFKDGFDRLERAILQSAKLDETNMDRLLALVDAGRSEDANALLRSLVVEMRNAPPPERRTQEVD